VETWRRMRRMDEKMEESDFSKPLALRNYTEWPVFITNIV
jgi:hypothetical protein